MAENSWQSIRKKVNMFHGLYIIEHSSNSSNGNVNTMEILETWTDRQIKATDQSQTPPPRMLNRPLDKNLNTIINCPLTTMLIKNIAGFLFGLRGGRRWGHKESWQKDCSV